MIYPYNTDTIYYENSVIDVAKKCYKVLRKKNNDSKYFCVLNMDNGTVNNFQVETIKNTEKIKARTVYQSQKVVINKKNNEIDQLKEHVEDLEKKLNIVKGEKRKINRNVQKNMNRGCSIL